MKIEQRHWTKNHGWQSPDSNTTFTSDKTPQLVLVFGGRKVLEDQSHYEEIKGLYPDSNILMCSTAGEIMDTMVYDDSLALTAIYFEKTSLQITKTTIADQTESEAKGQELANQLNKDGLVHALIFTDGLKVNGTALVKGLTDNLPSEITVTGGMVGDGANFEKTLIGLNQPPEEGQLVLIGLYGESLKIGHGSMGGWDPFGPERTITKSDHNILYELDGQPALELYKKYLGEEAKGLPGTGLLFPLSLRITTDQGEVEVVRTLLSVDEDNQSMTFAGDMPEGTSAKLMKANFERLIDGAQGAAKMSLDNSKLEGAELALLISCVGRKLVLKEKIEEEIEAVQSAIGSQAAITGFYSYGEISPVTALNQQCQLHNQTMTITIFKET